MKQPMMGLRLTPAVQAKTAILKTNILDIIRMHGLVKGPGLQLADEEEDPMPALDESDPEDYHDAGVDTDDYESAQEKGVEGWHADVWSFHAECRRWRPRKPRTDDYIVRDLKAYMIHCIDQEQN